MRRLLPLLPVPAVLALLAALRPAIVTAPFASTRAFAVAAGVGAAGLAVLLAARTRGLKAVWAADVVVLLLVGAVVWPAFRVRTLEEAFPPVALAATASPAPTAAGSPTRAPTPTAAPLRSPRAAAPSTSPSPTALGTSSSVNPPTGRNSTSPRPAATAVLLARGSLEGIDHHATGTVALYRVGDRLAVRFEEIDVEGTPTPSVHHVDAGARAPDGGRRLGGLKAERGSFSYLLPVGTAAAEVETVLVWCDRYAVPIAASDLTPG